MTKEGAMRKLILAATAAATLVTPAVASASGSLNTNGPAKVPVHACVRFTKHGTKARLAKKCNRNERGVTLWMEAVPGRQGIQGLQGLTGLTGAAGKDGINGTNGTNGKDGVNGSNGKDGVQGLTGSQGQIGPQGPKGDQGPAGTSAPAPWSVTDVTTGNGGVVVPDGDAAVRNVSLPYEAGQTITIKGVVTGGSVATDDPVADVVINGVDYWSVNQVNPDYGVTKTQYVNTESFTQTLVPVTGNANTPAPSGTITQIGLTADNDGGQAGATVTFTDLEVNGVHIPLS
jgi:hypothetical protein